MKDKIELSSISTKQAKKIIFSATTEKKSKRTPSTWIM